MSEEVKKLKSFTNGKESNEIDELNKKLKEQKSKNRELSKLLKEITSYAKELESQIEVLKSTKSEVDLSPVLKGIEGLKETKSNSSESNDFSIIKQAMVVMLKQNLEIKTKLGESENFKKDEDYDLYYNLKSEKFKEMIKYVCFIFNIEDSYDSLYDSIRMNHDKIKRCKTMKELVYQLELDDTSWEPERYQLERRNLLRGKSHPMSNKICVIYEYYHNEFNNVDRDTVSRILRSSLCFKGYSGESHDGYGYHKKTLLIEHLQNRWDEVFDRLPNFDVDTWEDESDDSDIEDLLSKLTNGDKFIESQSLYTGSEVDYKYKKEDLEFLQSMSIGREIVWQECYLYDGVNKKIAYDYCMSEFNDSMSNVEEVCSQTVDEEWPDYICDNPQYSIMYAYKK